MSAAKKLRQIWSLFRIEAGRDPIFTPSIVQRFDFHPERFAAFEICRLVSDGHGRSARQPIIPIRLTRPPGWLRHGTSSAATASSSWMCGRRRWLATSAEGTAQCAFAT